MNLNTFQGKSTVSDIDMEVIKKKVTAREIEKWEVAQLNCNTESRSKPSDVFKKLESKRKLRHENFLKELGEKLNSVNIKTEENIKISSVEVKAHAEDFNDKLQDILKSIDTPKVVSFSGSVFLELQNKAKEYKIQQQKLVNEFYEDLIKFENGRVKQHENILQLACDQMRKIGYLLPYEVQTFVDHETMRMNQLSLNNRRCYEDLKLTLTLVTEQTFKVFMDKMFCIRENWVQQKLQEKFCNLQNKVESKIAKFIPETYARLEMKGQELTFQLLPHNLYSVCKAEEWSKNVEEVVATIEKYGKNLIKMYKKTLEAVLVGFNNDVEGLKAELSSVEILAIEERVIKPIFFETQNDKIKEIEELEFYWQEVLFDIRNHVNRVTEFLLDAGKLWDRHVERLCESKTLILRALEKAEKNNQAVLQDLEIKLNISLDVLRQEHDQSKLEKAYEASVTTLNAIKSKYESMYLNDVSTVEDFYKMMNLEADVLSADINEFIYEIHKIDHGNVLHCTSHYFQYQIHEEKPIFKEIQMCAQQIQVIKNWKQGVWLALESLSEKAREILQPRAESWINNKIEGLAEKKSVQLELLEKRFERVRVGIYDKRITEIQLHQEMFHKHKEKVEFALSRMKEDFQNLIAKELNKMTYVKENLYKIESNVMREDRPGVIGGNQVMMEKKKEELENEIKMSFERFRAECETKASETRQMNINYMKSIKLFHENGDYSSEEGKMFISLLETVDKEINTELKNSIKESTKEENDFLKKLSTAFNPLISFFSSMHEETLFHQEIQRRLRSFKENIRDVAKTIKLDFDFLKQQCYCLCNTLKNPDNASYDMNEKFWNYIIRLLYKNVSNLIYPMSLPEIAGQSIEGEDKGEGSLDEAMVNNHICCAGRFSDYITTSKTTTFRTSEKVDFLTCKDYKSHLFNCESPPEINGTFMNLMCNYFWNELDVLQKEACNFYKKIQGRKIIREDLTPADYDVFVYEILLKFQYYNTQVEQFWLQIILEFLPLLGRIKELANEFLEKKLYDYENVAIKTLREFEENFVACRGFQTTENAKEFEALDNKLLPLHGFPQNEYLLSELQEEVVKETARKKIQGEAAIKKFTNQIKCFRALHIKEKVEIRKAEYYYFKLRDTIFVEDLADNLLDVILEFCKKEDFYIKKKSSDSLKMKRYEECESASLNSGEIPEEHKIDIELLRVKCHSVRTYLKELGRIVERERIPDVKPPLCPPCPNESNEVFLDEGICAKYCEPKLSVLLEILDFEAHARKILERLDGYTRSLRDAAEFQKKAFESELYNWLNKWKLNVKKVLKLYQVKYEAKAETEEETVQIPKLKSRSLGSKATLEEKNLADIEYSNLQKSKLTEIRYSGQVGLTNTSLLLNSPRYYHGQIPVLRRRSLNYLRMSPPDTRSPSPMKKASPPPKEKSLSKVKTITFEQDTKKKIKTSVSRSPSPVRRTADNFRKSKSRTSTSPVPGSRKNSEKLGVIKRGESKQSTSPRTVSLINKRSKSKSKVMSSLNLECSSKSKPRKELQIPIGDSKTVLKQTSQPSLSMKEKKLQPKEKISLGHLKNEVYSGDHRRLSFEKVQLCIEKSVKNLGLGEKKRSYVVTYSSKDVQQKDQISLTFLQNISSTSITAFSSDERKLSEETTGSQAAIRTLSGHELILTPSMKLDIERADINSDDVEISEILHETGESFEETKAVHIPQDDANEYDSEVSTDGEVVLTAKPVASGATVSGCNDQISLWRSREADLLNDVDYRQSVYHPAVSRRQKSNDDSMDFTSKSKSTEDNFHFPNNKPGSMVRSCSPNLKSKYTSPDFTADKMDDCSSDRSWDLNFDGTDGKQIYNSVIQDVPFYGMKRARTKKERISGVLLHFTLKIIRLLAIFNLWPGDNCHLLTSQSLRFAR